MRRKRVWLVGALCLSALVCTPALARAGAQLVVPSSSLRSLGLRAGRASLVAARNDLGAGLPRSLAHVVGRAQTQATAASGPAGQLRSDAFVLGSPPAARRVLAAWRRAHRGARQVAVGQQGFLVAGSARAFGRAVVAWRDGARIGIIALRAGRAGGAGAAALRFAALGETLLTTRLPSTAWERVASAIRPNGSVSLQTALQAFALVYGPLPGVHAPSGGRTAVPSGTLVGAWVLRYRARLSPRLRRAVDRDLGFTPRSHAARVASLGDSNFHPSASITATAGYWEGIYADAGHLAHQLKLTIVAGTTSAGELTTKDVTAYADAYPVDQAGEESDTGPICRIRVSPEIASDAPFLSRILAHEVFHCFEFALDRHWTEQTPWVMEGMAEWAALNVDPNTTYESEQWLWEYVENPDTPLFERTYDAVGFYGHAHDAAGNLWPKAVAFLNADTNEAQYAIAGGNTEPFLSTWGSSVFRSGSGGAPWSMVSPVVPPDVAQLNQAITNVFGDAIVLAVPYATHQYRLSAVSGAPIVHIAIDGHARLDTSHNYTALKDAWFCMGASPCVCPPDTTGTVPDTAPLSAPADLGLTGDEAIGGTAGSVTYLPLSHFCRNKQPRPPGGGVVGGGPSGGNGVSNGDPFLTTFDGIGYAFQAAGEYSLVKSTVDRLEVQARQQPYPARTFGLNNDLALNTAFAMRVGRATVEIDRGSPLVVRVNKRRLSLRAGQELSLAGGGHLSYGTQASVVLWPDGTRARVFSIGSEGVNIAIHPSAVRAGHLTGLLGNDNGSLSDDFVSRGGHHYPTGLVSSPLLYAHTHNGEQILYHQYGNSWRVTQSHSLFAYERGKSTRSYTIMNYPHRLVSLSSLSAASRKLAQAVCHGAGVTNQALLQGCMMDVGATGSRVFATSDGTLQSAAGIPAASGATSSPIPWTQLSSHTDQSILVIPTLASAGSAVVAAYQRTTDNSIETASFTPSAGGLGAVSRVTPFTGWSAIGSPILFPTAGGGLQMIFAGSNTGAPDDPLTGIVIAQRNPDGSFAAPALATPDSSADVDGAALAADGSTPQWSAAPAGGLAVYRGASSASTNDLSSASPGTVYSPELAYDHAGRLWLAWYVIADNEAQSGLYMLQLDPASGAAAGTPVQVPGSGSIDNDLGHLALACAQICRIVYDNADSSQLESWAPGDAAPAAVATDPGGLRDPTAAYTADGRLWVTWTQSSDQHVLAKLGDTRGAGGSPIATRLPAGYTTPRNGASIARGTQLVLVRNWESGNRTAVFATVVNPPG